MSRIRLAPAPLEADAFAPFGDVIEAEGSAGFPINAGQVIRFHDLARLDLLEANGHPLVSIFRANAWPRPRRVAMMERHPRSSQAFVPLDRRRFLVVVAPPGDAPEPRGLRAFISNGRQGVNYRRGVWHHPLLALDTASDFLVIDRGADDDNCDEVRFPAATHEIVIE